MTHAEIKAAFMDECPVMFNGVRYRRVSALIYRKNPTGTGLVMQAELLDQNYRRCDCIAGTNRGGEKR